MVDETIARRHGCRSTCLRERSCHLRRWPCVRCAEPGEAGEILKVKAEDCISGDPWTAYVEIDLLRGGLAGTQLVHREKLADDDGTTMFKVRLKKKKFKRGVHTATVECIHDFPMGGPGSHYVAFREFRVKRARS